MAQHWNATGENEEEKEEEEEEEVSAPYMTIGQYFGFIWKQTLFK